MAEGRWMDREAVARHVSVRVDYVARLVKAGKLPRPSYHLGPKCPRWDRQVVDSFFECGLASPPQRGHDDIVQAAVEDIIRRG